MFKLQTLSTLGNWEKEKKDEPRNKEKASWEDRKMARKAKPKSALDLTWL